MPYHAAKNMDLGLGSTLLPGDPRLIDHIVGEVKSQGIFDQFRKDALADVDTKPAYQNLRTRVESSVNSFLAKQTWKADLNKNQLRETLRKHISVASYLDTGVERIVDQVVNPKIYSVFMPQIEDVVYEYLGLEKPKREENGLCGLKDLLPIDLDPVSPESDKNSLKDVSLDSVDADLTVSDIKQNKESVLSIEESKDNDIECDKVNNYNEEGRPSPSNALADINLNDSIRSDEKMDEEDEESPSFEPIDIMNLNESNISNDSHLSGISELTSHRSCSPGYTNEFLQENFDFSNHDSQFSKVSSNSHLSIVTDFGSSNQAFTSISETSKDENSKSKSLKNNFQAIRDAVEDNKTPKLENPETNDPNISKNLKESSRDSLSSRKDSDNREKEKNRESSKLKSGKESSDSRSSKNSRDRDRDTKRKSSSSDNNKNDSSSKSKTRDKSTSSGDGTKSKEIAKDGGKKTKDLKDIYKEKIRELREKKELTEKEKLIKDPAKDLKHKKSSSKDKKEVRQSSSKSSSSSADNHSNKLKSEGNGKTSKSSSRDASKSEDVKKEKKERSHSSSDRKSSKSSSATSTSTKRESRSDSHTRSSDKSKRESDSKDKKRREEKKSKSKDDHSSLRKNFNDRRSSDRDGSNGSNGKGDNNSSPTTPTAKAGSTGLSKESSTTIGNSNSEASHGVDESKTKECTNINDDPTVKKAGNINGKVKTLPEEQKEISLPLKKRPLNSREDGALQSSVKKPKFARNFQEAKKMVKLRKKLEKQKQVEAKKGTESPLLIVPDDKRVQIIEFPVNSDDELSGDGDGYEKQAILILEPDEKLDGIASNKSKLSEMELAIRESLNSMMSGQNLEEGLNKENVCVLNLQTEDEEENGDKSKETEKIPTTSIGIKEGLSSLDDEEDCRYFVADSERLLRFNKFLHKLGIDEYSNCDTIDQGESKTMAPPQTKRKYSVSPLSDILLSSNNNDSHAIEVNQLEEEKSLKSKRMRRSKKPGPSVSSSSPQKITNGEHFVMPLSPESDVSVTSDKTTSLVRDDKSRARSSQHYTSDDLYKPRPLFVGSSRRNRRSHQA